MMEQVVAVFGIENVALFFASGILLNLVPGPDTLYIVGRSLGQGRGAGIAAALGIGSGTIVHTLLGAFGFSAILTTSVHAFAIVKIVGCGYLLYQGILMLRSTADRGGGIPAETTAMSLSVIYRQGALTNILNPKVAVFFLAFLPQFIALSSPSKPLSFMTTGTIWCLVVALFASSLGRHLNRSSTTSIQLRRISGILFILLGLKLATARLAP